MWVTARETKPLHSKQKIKLNWLKVDKATKVLRSEVVKDRILATVRVHKTTGQRTKLVERDLSPLNFNKRNKPAVTKVEEWTKEETGVGALIAAGSQTLKGNWALFVILVKAQTTLKPNRRGLRNLSVSKPRLKTRNKDKSSINKTSPIRLEKTVILDDKLLEGLR